MPVKPIALLVAAFIAASTVVPVLAQTPVPAATAGAQPAAAQMPRVTDEYRLAAGDVIAIKFFYNADLNEQLPIRPDGKIALQFVGEIQAAGVPVAELRRQLMEKYRPVLKDPELVVIVASFGAQKVFVGGEVGRPGEVPLIPDMTPLQAIIMAGGDRRTASTRNVVIVRDQGTDTPLLLLVDIKKGLSKGQQPQTVRLQPRDIVFVPMSKIAKVDNFVSQYMRDVIPASLMLGLYYNFGAFLQR